MRSFQVIGLILLVVLPAWANKPNIVLMMVDDIGIGDTSAYLGKRLMPKSALIGKTIRTPQLERFSKSALLFTDVHAGASMCSSSRYSLLTGRFGHRPYLKRQGWLPHGPNLPMIRREMVTLPEMLQANGYHTGCIGKYHVGIAFDNGNCKPATHFYHHDIDFSKPLLDGPTHHGFHEFFGVPGNTEDALDTEPRIYLRNDRWTFNDRGKMRMTGFKRHAGKIISDPSWDLTQIGPVYLREVESFLNRATTMPDPFFLYYVPNSNHQQLWEKGRYAVPTSINGQPVAGASRMTDGSVAGERADMVLENDIAFGRLLELLNTVSDPRNPGHKLIDNTLVIFASDNGPNEGEKHTISHQSGGLRGKKASITEGGLRIPFLMYWKGHFEGGKINRTHFSLTDLYATFARLLDHPLGNADARDSYDVLDYWTGEAKGPDLRPRLMFCHLGPPFSNDAMSLREGPQKIISSGGVAETAIKRGNYGELKVERFYHLYNDPIEANDEWSAGEQSAIDRLSKRLLLLHNQGHARPLMTPTAKRLVIDDGWHNLRNDLTGKIGFEFRIRSTDPLEVTHLGMWDYHEGDHPVRDATSAPNDNIIERPTAKGSKGRTLNASHTIELTFNGNTLASASTQGSSLDNEFRFTKLPAPIHLQPGKLCRLTMSTKADDGDQFHNPAAYDGLSPEVHPRFEIVRAIYLTDQGTTPIPTYFDAQKDYWRHRLPVGPTLKFR
ncbi:MAG: sulfatase-like hydrolase/transferase [Limisphaerales bacterium]